MYFKEENSMSPKVLENCNNFFYIINVFFIAVIFGYLIYNNDKNK
jgi:hypothetical protein